MPAESSMRIARRLRLVRVALYGEDGEAEFADTLGLPPGTWANYEAGVTIPGHAILRVLALTGVCPRWLLAGDGPPTYLDQKAEASADGSTPIPGGRGAMHIDHGFLPQYRKIRAL
ncbi:hypothetical protein TA3x_005113 [Tundrisphaera sp. TA3]|uniref:hypothetical protein n=1 Tax=Tundrisphaera sp. TA3 TaxID=3435775 RepID=UPI003EB6FD9C